MTGNRIIYLTGLESTNLAKAYLTMNSLVKRIHCQVDKNNVTCPETPCLAEGGR